MRITTVMLAAMVWPLVSRAADQPFDIKPGLWNISSTTQMSGMPPIPNLDKMTPEQRARIEGAMKNMSGSPQTSSWKSCVTKDTLQNAIARANSKNNNCTSNVVNMSASRIDVRMDCTPTGDSKSTGNITLERRDSEHFTGNGTVKTTGSGRSMDIKWSMTGTFVSSDCGDVKPSGE